MIAFSRKKKWLNAADCLHKKASSWMFEKILSMLLDLHLRFSPETADFQKFCLKLIVFPAHLSESIYYF